MRSFADSRRPTNDMKPPGSTGTGKGRNGRGKVSYIDLGQEQLRELFPSVEEAHLMQVFRSVEHDMGKAIAQVSNFRFSYDLTWRFRKNSTSNLLRMRNH